MAKQRFINTHFWDDPYIETLSPDEKLLFLYLITTPLTNIAGSFEITVKKMRDHTALDAAVIGRILTKFDRDRKFIYRDNWMLAVNAVKHQKTSNTQINTGIETILAASPEWVRDGSYMAPEVPSHLNLDLDSDSDLDSKTATATQAETAVENVSVERRIWKDGVELLKAAGVPESNGRPLLGRLAKEHTKILLAECIAATQAENPADPKTYLIGVLNQRSGKNDRQKSQVGSWAPEQTDSDEYNCKNCLDDGYKYQSVETEDGKKQLEKVPCPDCSQVREEAAA